MYNDFRFFTPLKGRFVQNDRINIQFNSKTLCVSDANRT